MVCRAKCLRLPYLLQELFFFSPGWFKKIDDNIPPFAMFAILFICWFLSKIIVHKILAGKLGSLRQKVVITSSLYAFSPLLLSVASPTTFTVNKTKILKQ